jgi:fumarate reductase flavoprotein subunit
MGGIDTDIDAATRVEGLYAAGECACVSINGANRLGSNSLTELLVFGARAGRGAAKLAKRGIAGTDDQQIQAAALAAEDRVLELFRRADGTESISGLRREMNDAMEAGAGIYRSEDTLKSCTEALQKIRERYQGVMLADKSNVFNTDLVEALELGAMIDVATAMACSALQRKESRGSHQRLDHPDRDDSVYLKHSLAHYSSTDLPGIDYSEVTITRSQPAERVYGGAQE